MKNEIRIVSLLAILALASLNAESLLAQTGSENPPGKPQTLAEADALLARASALREAAEREHATEKEACYAKILVNSCLADAKDKQRTVIINARKLEAPAREFKREMRRADLAAKEAKRADDLVRRQAEEKISSDNYRAQEAAKALEREQKSADKAKR